MWNKAQRREIVVRGDGNCFYRAISLWNDTNSDQNYDEIRSLVNQIMALFPDKFEPFLFQSPSMAQHLAKSTRSGTWAETVDIVACATLFQRSIFVYSMSQSKWNRFKPVLQHHVTSPCLSKKACQCPITLVLHDLNPAAAHFNLLIPVGHCCATPAPFNSLQEKKKSYTSVLKQRPGSTVNGIATSTNAEFLHHTASSSKQSTACNDLPLKHPPIPRVNSADSLNSTGNRPAKADLKPSTTAANQSKANEKTFTTTYRPNNNVKPSSTANQPKANVKISRSEGKSKTDVKPTSSAKQSKANGKPSPSEGETKTNYVKPSLSGKLPKANGTPSTSEGETKTNYVKPSSSVKQSKADGTSSTAKGENKTDVKPSSSKKKPKSNGKSSTSKDQPKANAKTSTINKPSANVTPCINANQHKTDLNPSTSSKTYGKPCLTANQTTESNMERAPSGKPAFEKLTIRELKEFIQNRGVTVSGYNKPELIVLANAIYSMNLDTDPNFENDSLSQCINSRLTLPAGKVVADPLTMTGLSNDFSNLPPFGFMDIFNHLTLSKADYDKEKLASFRSFDEYTLFQDGYVRSLGLKTAKDNDRAMFYVIVGEVIPTQKELTQEGTKYYKLWFILQPNGSIYSAFCRCKGGADQGCRHLGAALYELDDFLSNNRNSVTSIPAYWNPKPTPCHKPIPFNEMKISHSIPKKGKRKVTPCDESWVDSFDPRPKRHRADITLPAKIQFAQRLAEIDPDAAILKFLPSTPETGTDQVGANFEGNTAHVEKSELSWREQNVHVSKVQAKDTLFMSISSKAEAFVKERSVSVNNVQELAKEFCGKLSLTNDERDTVNIFTRGQRENQSWFEMRHLMVTGTKIKSIYTRQKTLEKNPETDVTTTVRNFLCRTQPWEKSPIPVQYGIEKEKEAKLSYTKLLQKCHHGLSLEETGLLVSKRYSWLGASLDGIRKCKCCKRTVVEFKCPFNGKDLDPKSAFLLESVGGTCNADGKLTLKRSHKHYYQVQTEMAVSGIPSCDFVIYTNKGILIVQIDFDKQTRVYSLSKLTLINNYHYQSVCWKML